MLLTALILLPAVCALPLLLVREQNAREIKMWAFLASLATFVVSLPLWNYNPAGALYQFTESYNWVSVGGLNLKYSVGVDGITALLILLTTFITPIAILGAFNYIGDRQKEFYIAMLVLETAMIGAFAATDLFLFYVFFEASLIPMYLMIGIWGGDEKLYATTKFILYTAFGSLLMFVAILFIYFKTGAQSFGISQLTEALSAARASGALTQNAEIWCFWAFTLAFAIKVPLFPVHTWLPDAHVQAPTPGSVILAAVLLKMGGYGFIRFVMPFFPDAVHIYTANGVLLTICVLGIVYGSLMAFVQRDVKKLVAYSSVAHMGTCMLGIFSFNEAGVQGGIYQMLNHGISTSALFLLIGMLYERTHTRMIDYYSGIAKVIPVFTVIFIIITMSSIGLPLTNGFVGEFLALLGAFYASPWHAVIAGTGVVLGAVYMLYMVKRVFFGKVLRESNKALADVNGRELAVLVPLVAMVFIMGLMPTPFFNKMDPAVKEYLRLSARTKSAAPAKPTAEAVQGETTTAAANATADAAGRVLPGAVQE